MTTTTAAARPIMIGITTVIAREASIAFREACTITISGEVVSVVMEVVMEVVGGMYKL